MERWVGHASFIWLLCRELFSVFGAVYPFIRRHRDEWAPLTPGVRKEIFWAVSDPYGPRYGEFVNASRLTALVGSSDAASFTMVLSVSVWVGPYSRCCTARRREGGSR